MAAATTTNLADVPMPVLAIQVDTWRNTDTRNPAAPSAGWSWVNRTRRQALCAPSWERGEKRREVRQDEILT